MFQKDILTFLFVTNSIWLPPSLSGGILDFISASAYQQSIFNWKALYVTSKQKMH